MTYQLLLSLAIRSFAPPLVALMVVAAWRKSSASSRRMVWLMCFVALAVLPLALIKLPTTTLIDLAPAATSAALPAPKQTVSPIVSSVSKAMIVASSAVSAPMGPSLQPATRSRSAVARVRRLWVPYGLPLWALGAFLLFVHWFAGFVRLSRLRLQPVVDDTLISELGTACRRVGLTKMPRLSTSAQATAPMVFGQLLPHIVLPVEARDWSASALQAAFLHECAHVRRGDWLGLMLSRLVISVYWFNPLAWLAVKQFRAECEAAADDMVLLNGVSPTSYAGELLRIATEVRPRAIANSLALIEVGPLKKRVERILESKRSRRSASRGAICLSMILSLALTAGFAFSYQVVSKPVVAHGGRVDLGKGKFVRIIAIARRTASGTQAWNLRGELLPNSIPLSGPNVGDYSSGENLRYIVFAHNVEGVGIEESAYRNVDGARNVQAVMGEPGSGYGYGVGRIDGDAFAVANFDPQGADSITLHCQVWTEPALKPWPPVRTRKIVFENVPLNPMSGVATTPELDVRPLRTTTNPNEVGDLIGIADLSHPEWGYWRPDGTPLPTIPGVELPRPADRNHPVGNITREIGLLIRSREGSTDCVGAGDVSGVLLCGGIDRMHTPSGRYDLNEVFVEPSLKAMTVVAKVPRADTMVAHLNLKRLTPATESKKIIDYLSHRMYFDAKAFCFSFDKSRVTTESGIIQSLKFLQADGSTPAHVDVTTDWEDGAVAIHTEHPERIKAANLLQHGYDYFTYDGVALFPKGRG